MTLDPTSTPNRPWLAALMSAVLPGLGQLYNGRVNRAIWVFVLLNFVALSGLGFAALYVPHWAMLPLLLAALLLAVGCWIYAVGDAWRDAARHARGQHEPWQRASVYVLVFLACQFLFLPWLVETVRSRVQTFRIPSASMTPGIQPGDYVFADMRYNCPQCRGEVARGDVVIFVHPNNRNRYYVKRVVGLPGDRIELGDDDRVTVNGTALSSSTETAAEESSADGSSANRSSVNDKSTDQRLADTVVIDEHWEDRYWAIVPGALPASLPGAQPGDGMDGVHGVERADGADPAYRSLTVPAGHVYLLGDYRPNSVDSRSFGTVPLSDVVARLRQVWWSQGEAGVRWSRIGLVIR